METAGKLRMDFSHALIKMPGLFGITSDLIGKHAAHVYLINFNHIYPTKVLNFQRRDQQERLFQIPTTSHFFFTSSSDFLTLSPWTQDMEASKSSFQAWLQGGLMG
jgi:hypothetical protein